MIQRVSILDTPHRRLSTDLPASDVPSALARPTQIVWVDILAPTSEDLDWLADTFHFHPLALEDCAHAHQRPKVDTYDGYFFVVLYDALFEQGSGQVRELAMFWGGNYVVTVHAQPIPDLDVAWQRWFAADYRREQNSGLVAYLIFDTIVDNYFPVIEQISERLEAAEESIFTRSGKQSIRPVFALKKELIQLRKVVVPLRDVFTLLIRREVGLIDSQTLPYLQDVYDHLIRVADAIDTQRDLISSTVDAYLSTVANRTNEIMRRLTILSTILLTPTVFAGIWGMNFQQMPELNWTYGYPLALVLMLLAVALELVIFRHLGYFGRRD